jgi:tetraacyldisaccharide 4'-kinase
MKQQSYRNLISGRSTGLVAELLRFLLGTAATGYSLIVKLRNFLYSKRWLEIHTANMLVISIGNITTGGTGKTPLVIWLCNTINQKSKIKNQKCEVAILTRGYKTEQNYTDEPAILAESCPQAKVIINPDRVAAARLAVGAGANVLIMDDGFQHRRLYRDLDIVTIDATCPFGYGKLLPAGLLREPVASLKRADAAVLTRCDQISESELRQLEKELHEINPDMIIAKSIHNPISAKSTTSEEITIKQLMDRKVFAFCGIGNPNAFLSTIKSIGVHLAGSKIYNDHYHYTSSDIDDIYEQANRLGADFVLSTQKDYTHCATLSGVAQEKTEGAMQYEIPFAYLAVEIKFIAGEDKLKQLIEDSLAGKIHKKYGSTSSP